jgi:Spy/CpxP family protein refolding chaperone
MNWKHFALIGVAMLLIVAAIPLVAQNYSEDIEDYEAFDSEYLYAEDFDAEDFDVDYLFAQQGPMGDRQGARMSRFAQLRDEIPEELRISDEQRDQMRNLRTRHQKEMIPIRADLRVLRVELRELVSNGANLSALNSKIDQIGKLRTEIEKKSMAQRLAMRDVFTDEQREAFKDRMFMGGRGDWGGRGHGERHHRGFGDRDDKGPRGHRGGGGRW